MTMVQAVLVLIALAVIANLALMGAALLTERRRLREGVPSDGGLRVVREPTEPHPALRFRTLDLSTTTVSPEAFDRVVRVVAWIFLLSTTTIVAVTGLWKDNQAAILVLLALAGFFVLVVHDLVPAESLGSAKFIVEGSVAITFAAILVLLTGQDESPFFFTLPADRGRGRARGLPPGDARARDHGEHRATCSRSPSAGPDPFPPATVAAVGVNLTALLLLAYVGDGHRARAEAGRATRRSACRRSTRSPVCQPWPLLRRARARDQPSPAHAAVGSAC